MKLEEIISTSSYKVIPGLYIYASVSEIPQLSDCFMISKDDDEITAVFEQSKLPGIKVLEQNKDMRRLIELKVSVPFYAVGFLAAITKAISEKGCNNLIVSTYSKDYVLVTEAQFETAKQALKDLGFNAI